MVATKAKPATMIVYGWFTQDDDINGVTSFLIDVSSIHFRTPGGRVYSENIPQGKWFDTFETAKLCALGEWKQREAAAVMAIKKIETQVESDLE